MSCAFRRDNEDIVKEWGGGANSSSSLKKFTLVLLSPLITLGSIERFLSLADNSSGGEQKMEVVEMKSFGSA